MSVSCWPTVASSLRFTQQIGRRQLRLMTLPQCRDENRKVATFNYEKNLIYHSEAT